MSDPNKSAQPCGCDPGEHYLCAIHAAKVADVAARMGDSDPTPKMSWCSKSFTCGAGTRLRVYDCEREHGHPGDCQSRLSAEQVRHDAEWAKIDRHADMLIRRRQADVLEEGRGHLLVEKAQHVKNGPTRASTLPEDPATRKQYPVASGVLDYFPDALVAVAHVSWQGNEQHNPGEPLHWARGKSMDQDDTIIRHFLQRGTLDSDGMRHSAKLAWRALALLQLEIEREKS